MGVTVDTIGVDVVANMGRLDASMRQVEGRVDRTARTVDKKFDAAFAFRGLGKGLTAVAGVRAASAGLTQLEESLADETRNTAEKFHDVTDAMMRAVPVMSEIYQIGRAINGIATGRLQTEKQIAREMDAQARKMAAMKRAAEQRIDFTLDFQKQLEDSRFDAADTGTALGVNTQADLRLAQLEKEVEQMRRDAQAFLRGGERKQREAEIDEFEANRRRAIERDRRKGLDALQTASGPSFDLFSTVLGQFKAAVPSGAASKPASEDTAKETNSGVKETVAVLKDIKNAVKGMAFA